MRQRCIRGYELVHKIPFLADAAEIVYSHHERYDGAGYRRGLPSRQIPLGARIVSVANTLDSITSELCYRPARSYRPARTFQAAREEICMGAGRQFDPEIVKVFLSLPDNVWSDLTKEIQSEASMRMQSPLATMQQGVRILICSLS